MSELIPALAQIQSTLILRNLSFYSDIIYEKRIAPPLMHGSVCIYGTSERGIENRLL